MPLRLGGPLSQRARRSWCLTSDIVMNYHPAMTTAVPSVTWSAFQRDAKAVADRADESDILLRRRDGPDLFLGSAERHDAMIESVGVLSRVLAAVLDDPTVRRQITAPGSLPWLRFLPNEDREQFATEFVETAAASADLGTLTPLAELIREWRNTALVHADPRLAAAMRREHPGDGDLVPRPAG